MSINTLHKEVENDNDDDENNNNNRTLLGTYRSHYAGVLLSLFS